MRPQLLRAVAQGQRSIFDWATFYRDFIAVPELNPAGAIGGPITFSRAGAATRGTLSKIVDVGANVPRMDCDVITGAPLGWLLEAARTNLVTESSAESGFPMLGAGRQAQNVTFVSAPDATALHGASVLAITVTSATQPFYQVGNYALNGLAASTTYTATVWVRFGAGTNPARGARLEFFDYAGGAYVQSNSAIVTAAVAGWQKLTVSRTTRADIISAFVRLQLTNATAGDELHVDCWQVELGGNASSFIATGAATATRAEDAPLVSGTAFSDFYNPDEGTLLYDFDTTWPASTDALHLLKLNGGDANFVALQHHNSSVLRVAAAGVAANFSPAIPVVASSGIIVGSFGSRGGAVARNGSVSPAFSPLAAMPTGVAQLRFANWFSGYSGPHQFGHVRRVAYWRSQFSREQILALSTP